MPPFWVLHIYGRRGKGGQIVKLPPTTYPRWAAAFATGTGPLLPSVAPPHAVKGTSGRGANQPTGDGCGMPRWSSGWGEISKVTQ